MEKNRKTIVFNARFSWQVKIFDDLFKSQKVKEVNDE